MSDPTSVRFITECPSSPQKCFRLARSQNILTFTCDYHVAVDAETAERQLAVSAAQFLAKLPIESRNPQPHANTRESSQLERNSRIPLLALFLCCCLGCTFTFSKPIFVIIVICFLTPFILLCCFRRDVGVSLPAPAAHAIVLDFQRCMMFTDVENRTCEIDKLCAFRVAMSCTYDYDENKSYCCFHAEALVSGESLCIGGLDSHEFAQELCNELNSFLTETRSNGLDLVSLPIDPFNIAQNPEDEYEVILWDDAPLVTNVPNGSATSVSQLSDQAIRCVQPHNPEAFVVFSVYSQILCSMLLLIGAGLHLGAIPQWVRLLIARVLCTLISVGYTAALMKTLYCREPKETVYRCEGRIPNVLIARFDYFFYMRRVDSIQIRRSALMNVNNFASGRRYSLSILVETYTVLNEIGPLTEDEALYLAYELKQLQSTIIR